MSKHEPNETENSRRFRDGHTNRMPAGHNLDAQSLGLSSLTFLATVACMGFAYWMRFNPLRPWRSKPPTFWLEHSGKQEDCSSAGRSPISC